jgi:hypothetical protein
MAELLGGEFSIVDDAVKVINADQFTRDQFNVLAELKRQVAERAKTNPEEIVPREFIDALKSALPTFAAAWALLENKRFGWAFLLIFVTALMCRCSTGGISIDLSTHNETHYHIEQPLKPDQLDEQENKLDPNTPEHSPKADDVEGDGAVNLHFTHSSPFRRDLMSSTALSRVQPEGHLPRHSG